MVHDLSTPENSLSVFIWDYLLPDRQRGSAIEGILTLEFVQSYEKKPVDSVSHIQAFNHIGLEAVVKVIKILDSYHVLVKAGFSDKLLLVCFESSVHPEPCDFIHVKKRASFRRFRLFCTSPLRNNTPQGSSLFHDQFVMNQSPSWKEQQGSFRL